MRAKFLSPLLLLVASIAAAQSGSGGMGTRSFSGVGLDPVVPQLTSASLTKTYQNITNSGFTANVPVTIATVTGGPGVIKDIWLTCNCSLSSASDSHIQVYVDGVLVPQPDIEIGVLGMFLSFGGQYQSMQPGCVATPYVNQCWGNTVSGSTPSFELDLKWPIPFSSTVTVQWNSPLSGSNTFKLYSNVNVQFGVSSPRRLVDSYTQWSNAPTYSSGTTYPLGAYVMEGTNEYISIANGNVGNTPPNAAWWQLEKVPAANSASPYYHVSGTNLGNGSTVLADFRGSPTWIIGFGIESSDTSPQWLENSPMIYNGNPGSLGTAGVQWTGFEDSFGCADYFNPCAPMTMPAFGTTRTTINPTSATAFQNTTGYPQIYAWSGGSVTAVAVSANNSTYDTISTAANGEVLIQQGQYVEFTFTGTPTFAAYPQQIPTTLPQTGTMYITTPANGGANGVNAPTGFKDWLAEQGGIYCPAGCYMDIELPPLKTGPFGSGNTQFGFMILAYK